MSREELAALAGLTLLAMSEVPNFLAGLLPSTMTIGRFAADPVDRARLRRSEVVGSALSLSVGVGASLLAVNPMPFIACAVVLVVLLYEYERAIRHAQGSGAAVPMNEQPGLA